MRRFFFLSLIVVLIAGACNNTPKQNGAKSGEEKLSGSSRSEKNGWILIHLEGSPETMGYQHGYLLANEILNVKGATEVRNLQATGRDWNFFREESYRILWSKVPDEYRREMQGIADGVNAKTGRDTIDIRDIVAINSSIEIPDYYVPVLDGQEKASPPEHCSAFAATGSWTSDGKIVMAHNNWSEYLIGEKWNVIFDMVPEKGNRIVMDALPGYIHSGDDFNINSAGLIVTETTISGFMGFDTAGVAEFVRARKAIQYASTIDEWVATMLNGNNGGYANDWLIGDNKTGEIARLELGLKNHFLDRVSDGYLTGANFPVHEKLIKEETSYDPGDKYGFGNMRRERWEQLMQEYKGKITVETAKIFMGDHRDLISKEDKASRYTLCGHIDEDETGKPEISWTGAHFPAGAVQAKATDATLASRMQMWAIMGHPCGEPFNAKKFLEAHPEYSYQKDYLTDMPGQEWLLTDKIK